MSRPLLRVLGASTAACAAVLAVSACTAHPGAAAVVGGTRISVGELNSEVAVLNQTPADVTADGRRQALANLITTEIITKAASQKGVSAPTGGDIREVLDYFEQANQVTSDAALAAGSHIAVSSLTNVATPIAWQVKLGRALAKSSTLDVQAALNAGNQYLSSFAGKVPVSVSPRYGTWDPANGGVNAATGALFSLDGASAAGGDNGPAGGASAPPASPGDASANGSGDSSANG